MTSLSIQKYVCFLIAVLLWPFASPISHAQKAARFEAAFFDGTRVEGDKVFGWHEHPGSPRLDNTALFDAKRPLRWLRDRRLKPWRAGQRCRGYIEFVGGDRLVGRIVGLRPGGETDGLYVPAHLLVKPAVTLRDPVRGSPEHVRILSGRIQRVVFGPAARRRLRPGTLYCLDGRQLAFLGLRWQEDSVVLLLKDGTREVKLSEITEAHLPQIDPWKAYYKELAVLSPGCRSRLTRLETTGGLVATGSDLRFSAVPYGRTDVKRQAMEHLKHLDEQIARMQNELKGPRGKLDEARAEFVRESARLTEQFKGAQKAYEQAKAQMQQRIDRGNKGDDARWAAEREKIDRELRSADEAMVKQTAGEEPQKRDNMLKEFRLKQAELRKTRVKSLKDARIKSERQRTKDQEQRRKELERFTTRETRKLKRMEADLTNRINQLKARADQAAERWKSQSGRVDTVKSQRASARGTSGDSDTWYHIVQPVWSLDPLWMSFDSIHMRWSFAPQQVPLSRVPLASTVSPPLLPGNANHNATSPPLHSGGRQYAWGFAVHAYSELRFPLPQCASAFHSSIGLDRIVGPGGCARARVFVGSTKSRPAYEGPLLVGSKKTVDTGRVGLVLPPRGPRHLVLQADPVDRDYPPGADPLNIRDKLDWLDPRLELDTAALRDEVRRQIGPVIAAAEGWSLALDRRGDYTWTSRFRETRRRGDGRFVTMLRARAQPLRLSREMTIGPADKWLSVHVGLPGRKNPRGDSVALRVGGRLVRPRKVPIRQQWQNWFAPLVFPIADFQGKKITLELTQPAGGEPLQWQAVSISAVPPPAYRLVEIMEFVGTGDTQVSSQLGRALQSKKIGKTEKLAAIEISRLGGVVNYRADASADTIANVLVGRGWTGGDKAFIKAVALFEKMPSLKTLLVTKDSGVSPGATAKLRNQMPKLTVRRFVKRVPSPGRWVQSHVTWRNLCPREVILLFINERGKLQFSRRLKSGQVMPRPARLGYNYEAHYAREGFTNGEHYRDSLPLTSFTVTPNAVWEIKPQEQ